MRLLYVWAVVLLASWAALAVTAWAAWTIGSAAVNLLQIGLTAWLTL